MPSDLPDVWRDEDGPHEVELERWASGEICTIVVDPDRRRLLRSALKSFWSMCSTVDRRAIDDLLAELKR